MSPAHVHEPTYRQLKRAITKGRWPLGTKLDAVRLANDLGVSITPVRDSLNRLVGEGLVDLTPGEGFRVAALSEQRLREILLVNLALLKYALAYDWIPADVTTLDHAQESFAERVAAAFVKLAEGSKNGFLVAFVVHINERLHFVRELEPGIIPSARSRLSAIERSLASGGSDLPQIVDYYHEATLLHVPQLIAAAIS